MKLKQNKGVLQRYFILLSVVQILIVSLVVGLFYYKTTAKNTKESYYEQAHAVAHAAAMLAKDTNLADYRNGRENDQYTALLNKLMTICKETEVVYVYYSVPIGTEENPQVEHLMVAGDRTPASGQHYVAGSSDPNSKENYAKIESVYKGEDPEGQMYLDNFNGNVMTAMVPVYYEGQIVAVASVDIEMEIINAEVIKNTVYVTGIIVGIFSVFVILFAFLINKMMLKPIGTLSQKMDDFMNVGDEEEPDYTPLDIKTLGEINTMVGSFNLMKKDMETYTEHLKNMTAENERIQTELDLAAKIQQTALPGELSEYPENAGFELGAFMKPAREVGGDFYDYFMRDKTHLVIVIADISGKGIPAALLMMKTKTLIADHAAHAETPAQALEQVNKILCKNNEESMFVTAFLGILDTESGVLTYSNAGHNPPLIDENGTVEYLKGPHDFVLGGLDTAVYRSSETVLKKGTRLLLYTDGVTEAFNKEDALFGEERLLQALKKADCRNTPPETALNQLYEALYTFCAGAPQSDDITMLAVDFRKAAENPEEKTENKMVLQAELDQLETALTFVDTILENLKADHKTRNQCALITEEIFVNICHYAYNEKGDITLSCTADQRERCLTLEFADKGKPFNPLEKEDPLKITETEEKTPGGYGIYMAKQLSDHMEYHYKEGENHLKIIKHYSVI